MIAGLLALSLGEWKGLAPIWLAAIYLSAVVVALAVLCRSEKSRADHLSQLLEEERVDAGRDRAIAESW